MEAVNVVFYAILVFVTINVFLSFILWKNSRREIFKRTLWFWLFNYITFGMQFFFPKNDENEIILVFGLVNITTILGYSIYCELAKVKGRYFSLFAVMAGATALTLLSFKTNLSFTVKSMPFAISMSIPLLHILRGVFLVKKSTTVLEKLLGFIFFLWIVHALDFTIFRMVPGAEPIGWMATYILCDLLGIILPALSIEEQTSTEQIRLKNLVAKQTEMLTTTVAERELLLKILVHDISNPLTGMKWSLKRVEADQPVDGRTLERIRYFQQQVEEIVKSVRLKQLEPGHQNTKPLSLLKSIEEVKQIFKQQLEEKNITIEILDLTDGQDQLYAEQISFNHNILSNFTSNAIKFSPPDSKISFEITRDSEYLTLAIQDQGQGMPQEIINKMHHDNRLTSTQGTFGETGSGYGLSIARSVLQSMGAILDISTGKPGQTGTRITMKFPFN